MPSFKYQEVVSGVALVLIVWVISVLGGFQQANGYLYDSYVEVTPEEQMASKNILLVEAPIDTKVLGDEVWLKALQKIRALGAKAVIFGFLPEKVSVDFYHMAAGMNDVFFGREIREKKDGSGTLIIQEIPLAAKRENLSVGLLYIPHLFRSIYRYQFTSLEIGVRDELLLETVVAIKNTPSFKPKMKARYLVNFNGNRALPKVSLNDLFTGKLIPEMVQGRTVFFGFAQWGERAGLHTPSNLGTRSVSPLEFHGFALDTLLSNTEIQEINPLILLAFLLALGVVSFVSFQLLKLEHSILLLIFLIVLFTLGEWLLLSYLYIWFPLLEVLLLQVVLALHIFRLKSQKERAMANEMILEASAKLEERLLPETFFSSKEHWEKIINIVKQTMTLKKVIFLERIEKDHRVHEVKALNCSLSDIQEMRRDFHREPYSEAINAGGLYRLENRSFFKEVGENDIQYMVPLFFSGQVLGFWAFVIDATLERDMGKFKQTVNDFASQVSELLFRREKWRKIQEKQSGSLERLMRLEGGIVVYRDLRRTLSLIEKRAVLLEDVFDTLQIGIILYDIFGSVLYSNDRMGSLLKTAGISPFTMSAYDLIVALTNLEGNDVKKLLHKVVVERKSTSLQVLLPQEAENNYMLSIRPLLHKEEEKLLKEAHPLEMSGILFELLDFSHISAMGQFKEELLEKFNKVFEGKIAEVKKSGEDLNNPAGGLKRSMLVEHIRSLQELEKMFLDVTEHLVSDIHANDMEQYPVHALNSLQLAIASLSQLVSERKISIEVSAYQPSSFVLASPRLQETFAALLTSMISDSVEETTVLVTLKEQKGVLHYIFRNKGFGIPRKRYHHCIYHDESDGISDQDIQKLRSIRRLVQKWGGRFETTSDVGVGIRAVISLKTLLK